MTTKMLPGDVVVWFDDLNYKAITLVIARWSSTDDYVAEDVIVLEQGGHVTRGSPTTGTVV